MIDARLHTPFKGSKSMGPGVQSGRLDPRDNDMSQGPISPPPYPPLGELDPLGGVQPQGSRQDPSAVEASGLDPVVLDPGDGVQRIGTGAENSSAVIAARPRVPTPRAHTGAL